MATENTGFFRTLPPDPPCPVGDCDPVGTVGNEYRAGHPHASTVVCGSTEHQAAAREWVNTLTGEDGIFALSGRDTWVPAEIARELAATVVAGKSPS